MDPAKGCTNSSPDYCFQALQQQYESVCASPRPQWKVENLEEHFKEDDQTIDSLADITFTKSDIEKACLAISSSSAAGLDGVPAQVMQEAAEPAPVPYQSSTDQLLLLLIC